MCPCADAIWNFPGCSAKGTPPFPPGKVPERRNTPPNHKSADVGDFPLQHPPILFIRARAIRECYVIASYLMAGNGILLMCRRKHTPPHGAADNDTFPPETTSADIGGSPINIRRSAFTDVSPFPEKFQRNGEDFRAIELQDGGAVVENDTGLEIISRLGCQAAEPVSI